MTCTSNLLFLVLGFVTLPALSQTSIAQQANAVATLNQMANVFSAGKVVRNVQLTGSAEWHAGGLDDSGSATLTASSTGAATLQLSLAKKGLWVESQSDISAGMNCHWAENDGIKHQGDAMNCLKPTVWFLPMISLQPMLMATNVGVADMGAGVIDFGTYRHLQSQVILPQMPNKLLSRSVEASTTDIGIDPNTLLPSVLRYQVHPDDGAAVNITIEVRFADYRRANGVEIPFLIQRYINGSLQLEIRVNSVEVN